MRTILLACVTGFLIFLATPCAFAGWGEVLTDEELDAVYAQGLYIVDVSFDFSNNAGRFAFNSQTAIELPEGPNLGSGAEVDFFDGSFLISTNPTVGSQGAAQPAGPAETPEISVSVSSPLEVKGQSGGSPPVNVRFGGGGRRRGGGNVLRITSNQIDVTTVVNIVVERKASGIGQRVIRNSLLGRW
jgi:hypothetical protein